MRVQWREVLGRPGSARRGPVWRAAVPVVALAAGLLFAISAGTARGTDLRSSQTSDLADLVRAAEQKVQAEGADAAGLQAQVRQQTTRAGSQDAAVAAAQAKYGALQSPAGLEPVHGAGLTVVLDDADPASVPVGASGQLENQYVVHQSDVQSVVNALWAGGAEAMTVASQRMIATSAVRCVGNTLLLNGHVYSPPFRVQAIGPAGAMQSALDHSPGVTLFEQAAAYYGLHYTVEQDGNLSLPGYDGSVGLTYAKAVSR